MVNSAIPRWVWLVTRLAVSAALLWLILSLVRAAGHSVNLTRLSPITVAAVIAIVLLQMAVISAWRLALVMQLLGAPLRATDAARITWSGFFVEQVGAVFLAGDAARIWLIRQSNIPLRTATEGPIIDRAIGLATIFTMALLGLPRLWSALTADQRHWLLLSAGLAGAALVALALSAIVLLSSGLHAARSLARLRAARMPACRILQRASLPRLITLVLLAFSTHSLNVFAIYLLLNGVGVTVGLGACFVFTPTVLLASMLPLSLSGWGVREGAFVLALHAFGVQPEHVITASVVFGLCVLTASLPGAIIWLTFRIRGGVALPGSFDSSATAEEMVSLPS
jgi:hypothetical protein